jgi:large subunit ribosomal protein L10
MDRDQKAQAVKEIGEDLEGASAVFAVDYRGISVTQAAELRGKLRDADASFSVVKNRLAKRATEAAGAADLDEHLVGPTALTYVRGDAVLAAKAISDFVKANGVPSYKGGIMDGTALDQAQFSSIARLPGVDVLRGQLVGLAASPLTGVVRTLNQLIQGLASQLGQVAEQGLVKGDAPAAEPEPEAAPEPEAEAETPDAEDAEIAEAQGTEEAGAEAAAEADDTTSETEAEETPDDGDDAADGDDKED